MIKVHCLATGWVQIKIHHQVARFFARPARVLDVLTDKKWSPKLPIGCWLIEHDEGLILVDTGESSRANDKGYQPWWHPFMQFCERRGVKKHEEVGEVLKANGFDPLHIDTVVMTHMHGDHAGGIAHFPNSRFVMSQTEKQAINAPNAVMNGYLTMHYPDWFKPDGIAFNDGAFESFEQSHKLTKDGKIRLVPTAGHTLGHLAVVVDMGEYDILIGGDASYSEQDMLAGNIDGVCIDGHLHQQSTAKMRQLCQRKPTITQFAYDEKSEYRLKNKVFTVVGD
ncbi:N-acyl homoserine lactonase family protein [Alysiella filiformis]|uniref:Metallo-beta-lactamase superfamily protein n=1 Tax=Alysiella filiformis DSM 16848 TaxID=1120981 RepID=A0A286E8X5_9NEIS|nr:N-acyl homoserine lactonase family protein [Alysiella filiformis]QMT32127.1 N-acyl homoserine lactonase family protein [Alysiella filiformis]UBQ56958.1 N-acyl homoserine lactonase family protein [Alysiella filiformis DSM 16848]SOD67341.1 Metallo-beta-lactamase superfamily protein [Alysiella filiformis DSM 16848]